MPYPECEKYDFLQLRSSVELLEKDAKFDQVNMREALQGLIKQASEASKFLRTDGPELVNKLSNR